ncbi:Uncharacterised protein [Bordetella pertussis]|nr:Uncharacterised protein [Bordetella pertussis]
MVANWPPANGAARSASPPSRSVSPKLWPLAWKMRPLSMAPIWLMAPSAGHSAAPGSSSSGRASGLSARVKKSLKLA